MYTDNGLLLADAQSFSSAAVGCNSGAGGINETSETLALDMANAFRDVIISDIGPTGAMLELAIHVTTAFTSGTAMATNEFRLISLPISLSLLTNGSGGASDGKVLSIASVVTTDTGDTFTIANHGLAVGTPFYLTSLATTGGVANNVAYYAIPLTANTFQAASSLANALAGTPVAMSGGNGTATVNFVPYVHASTGPIWLPFCGAGQRFIARVQPGFDTPMGKLTLPTGQTVRKQIGASVMPGSGVGGGAGTAIAPTPGRYLALQHVPSATMTAGAATVNLAFNTQTTRRSYPIGSEVY